MADTWNKIGGGAILSPGNVYLMPGARHQLYFYDLGNTFLLWTPALWGTTFRMMLPSFDGRLSVEDVQRDQDGNMRVWFTYSGNDLLDIGPMMVRVQDAIGGGATKFILYVQEHPAGGTPNPRNPSDPNPIADAAGGMGVVAVVAILGLLLLMRD